MKKNFIFKIGMSIISVLVLFFFIKYFLIEVKSYVIIYESIDKVSFDKLKILNVLLLNDTNFFNMIYDYIIKKIFLCYVNYDTNPFRLIFNPIIYFVFFIYLNLGFISDIFFGGFHYFLIVYQSNIYKYIIQIFIYMLHINSFYLFFIFNCLFLEALLYNIIDILNFILLQFFNVFDYYINCYANPYIFIFKPIIYFVYFIYLKYFYFETMYLGFFLIVFIPFLYFSILFCFGRFLGIHGAVVFLVISYSFVVYILCSCYYFFIYNNGILLFNSNFMFFDFVFFDVQWSFLLDSVNLIMCFIVILISFLVHLYSISYMRYDVQLIRFLSLLSLFTFCMLLLVTSNNLIQLFFGWEGVGLCSYLLVNFWFTRVQANKSAIKAMLMNRIGDISLLIFIAFVYYIYRTFDYSLILLLNESYKYAYINLYYCSIHLNSLLLFFLFVAVMGKSAQLGLHIWLPDAMEGPTPVSALIHAATMVTAGVFILIKYYFFLEYSLLKNFVFVVGSLTALFGAVVAMYQNDIKKVIAYSTCSQLGYMVVSCALGLYNLALFHLFNHAFFKALLFLSAGVILHALNDEQDMRKMGGLVNFLPFTYCCFFFASYALMGLPFLSGFYSKDIILEVLFYSFDFISLLSFYLLLLAAFCTAFYSFKLLFFVFFKKPKGFFINYKDVKEADFIVIGVFIFLFFVSVVGGYLYFDLFMGIDQSFLMFNVSVKEYNNFIEYEFVFFIYKLLPFIFSLLGILCGFWLYYIYNNSSYYYFMDYYIYIYNFFVNKWFFDMLYNRFFVNNVFKFSYHVTYKLIDKNFLELFGTIGFSYFVYKVSFFFKNYFSTYLYIYLFLFFNGFGLILVFFFYFEFIYLLFILYVYLICFYFFKKK